MIDHLSPSPCDAVAVPPCLLIGTEHALYREVLARAVGALRPGLPVHRVAPDELDAAVSRLRPLLVICSAVTATIEAGVCAWLLLQPRDGGSSVLSVAGARRPIDHPSMEELLGLVDEVWGATPV